MLNRRAFRNPAPMNLVYRSKQFNTQLWLGDYYAATDYNLLKSKNIKSVLTAAAMLGVAYPLQLQMNHKTINAFDIPSYKMTPHFQQAYQFIHDGLKKGNVLVHCAAGISRSTTCVLVYMMRMEDYTFNQALDIVRAKRSIVNPNYGFQAELKKYQVKLKKINNNNNNQKQQGNKNISINNNVQQSQKKAVLNFLQQNSQKNIQGNNNINENNRKFNNTVHSNNQPIYSKFLRGKSVNMGNTMGYGGNKLSGQQRISTMSSNKYNHINMNVNGIGASNMNNLNNINNMNNQQQNYHYQHNNHNIMNNNNKGVLNMLKNNDLITGGNKLLSVKIDNPKIVTIKK